MNAAILTESRAAHVSKDGLAGLAPLRKLKDIRIGEFADGAWVTWDGAMPSIVFALLPSPGVVFYSKSGANWRPIQTALPDFAAPNLSTAEMLAIDQAIVPAPVVTVPSRWIGNRVPVILVACQSPRRATAVRTEVQTLIRWNEQATTWEIEKLRGAICGSHVWLRGEPLPILTGAERFWGNRVLAPLGMRPEPDWPDGPIREAAGIDDSEILVLTKDGAETIPVAELQPLSRAGIRKLQES